MAQRSTRHHPARGSVLACGVLGTLGALSILIADITYNLFDGDPLRTGRLAARLLVYGVVIGFSEVLSRRADQNRRPWLPMPTNARTSAMNAVKFASYAPAMNK